MTRNRAPRSLFAAVRIAAVILLSAAAALGSSLDKPGEEQGLTNAYCPVTPDESVDPSLFTEHDGLRVYFCCSKCRRRFENDPESYLQGLAEVMPVSIDRISGTHPESSDGHGDAEHAHGDSQVIDEHTGAAARQHSSADEQESELRIGDSSGHDHATDHDHPTEHGFSVTAWLGRFHVVIIHFPIAFLLLAGVLELLGTARPKWSGEPTVRILVSCGAIASLVALALGLLHGSAEDYPGELSWVFWWHRALGITATLVAVGALIAVERRARRGPESAGRLATATVLVAAVLVGVTGHFGGALVYGWEFLLP